jgi:hypothetical protein
MNSQQAARTMLETLSADFQVDVPEATLRVYLNDLGGWNLSPSQWDRLAELAMRRLYQKGRLPLISQLRGLAGEILEGEPAIVADSSPAVWRIRPRY